MARVYQRTDFAAAQTKERERALWGAALATLGTLGVAASPLLSSANPELLFGLGMIPAFMMGNAAKLLSSHYSIERERAKEVERRGGKRVLGSPPQRDCFTEALADAQARG